MKNKILALSIILVLLVFLTTGLAFGAPAIGRDTQGNAERQSEKKNGGKEWKGFKNGELLVKFKTGSDNNIKRGTHDKNRSRIIKRFVLFDIEYVEIDQSLSIEEAIQLYEADPNVEYVEPNYIVYANDLLPNDPFFGELWNLLNQGQTGGTPGADIDALRAWSYTTGNYNVVVAVIDSGIDYNHVDLAQNMWVNQAEYDGGPGVDDDGNGYVDDIYGIDTFGHTTKSDPMDKLGHGTHIAGIIGAEADNGVGLVGVNWNVKIMACKFLNEWGIGFVDGAIECLEYVKAKHNGGINVVATNNSWGSSYYSQILYDAIDAQRDILFFASAGNENADNDLYPYYPASYYLPNVVSVASTDHNDEKALSSSFGRRTVHIGAPGVNIFSTLPEYTHWGASWYGHLSGTSMATSHATGLAALLKSHDMDRGWKEIKNLILSGGDNVESMNGITITGKRINAYRSLKCRNSSVFSVLKYPHEYTIGEPTLLSALSIRCESPVGPVKVNASRGEVIELFDNGVGADLEAGDGIFSAEWTPYTELRTLTFSSPLGREKIKYKSGKKNP